MFELKKKKKSIKPHSLLLTSQCIFFHFHCYMCDWYSLSRTGNSGWLFAIVTTKNKSVQILANPNLHWVSLTSGVLKSTFQFNSTDMMHHEVAETLYFQESYKLKNIYFISFWFHKFVLLGTLVLNFREDRDCPHVKDQHFKTETKYKNKKKIKSVKCN